MRRTSTQICAKFLQQHETFAMVVLRGVIHTLAVRRIRATFEQQACDRHGVRNAWEAEHRNTV